MGDRFGELELLACKLNAYKAIATEIDAPSKRSQSRFKIFDQRFVRCVLLAGALNRQKTIHNIHSSPGAMHSL